MEPGGLPPKPETVKHVPLDLRRAIGQERGTRKGMIAQASKGKRADALLRKFGGSDE